MKLEGEYAVDKNERLHRVLSGLFFALWIGLSFHNRGLGQAFKTAAFFILPMACIWFSESMASYTGVAWGSGCYVDEASHPTVLRWAGWFLLAFVPIALFAMFSLRG